MTSVGPSSAWIRAMPWVFVVIWATGFIVARYGMPHAPPMKFLALRFALSILCFLPWIIYAKVNWPKDRRQVLHLAVTGALLHAGYLGGVWAAVKGGMGSGLSSLIIGLQPVLTALWLSQGSAAVSRRQWLGLCLGFAGLLLVLSGKLGQGGEAAPGNLLLAVLALTCITIGTLYQKRFLAACDVRTALVVQLASAALLTGLVALILESEAMHWNGELVAAMAWSVLVMTLGGSSLLYLLIQRGAAASVSTLMYLVPPVTALMAWPLFSELISLTVLAGTALTAYGVSLVIRVPAASTAPA